METCVSKPRSKKENSSRRFYIFAAFLYTVLIFLFTAVARDLSNFLRSHGMLNLSIAALFFIAWNEGLHYFKKKAFPPDAVAYASLLFLSLILLYGIVQLPVAEEKIHFLEFGALALLYRKMFSWNASVKSQYLLALILTAGIGLLDEILQAFLPRRFFDPRDIALNALAGFLAILAYEITHNHFKIFRFKI